MSTEIRIYLLFVCIILQTSPPFYHIKNPNFPPLIATFSRWFRSKNMHILRFYPNFVIEPYFFTKILNAVYHWSQKLSHKFHGLSSKVHYFEHFVDYDKILDKNMLVIISEHLLHPLQLCITHWPKTGKLCPYYGSVSAWVDFNVISGFVEEMLPKIVKALHTFPNINFIFLAAAYRMYPHNSTESGNLRFEPIGVSMMDEYRVVLQKCHENVTKMFESG